MFNTSHLGDWGPASTAGPIVIISEQLFTDGFESADLDAWSGHVPAEAAAISK